MFVEEMNIKHSYFHMLWVSSKYTGIHAEPNPGKLPISIFFMFLEILQSQISQSWYVRKYLSAHIA